MIIATYRYLDTLADTALAASKYYLDAIDVDSSASCTGVVPCELLSNGITGSTLRSAIWGQSNISMDGSVVPELFLQTLCIDCTDTDHR